MLAIIVSNKHIGGALGLLRLNVDFKSTIALFRLVSEQQR